MIVVENVIGLINSHGGKDFDAIWNAIGECGYRAGALVIDASLFVPQSRERVFVVAVDADEYIPAALVADGPSVHSALANSPTGSLRTASMLEREAVRPVSRSLRLATLVSPSVICRWYPRCEAGA